MHGFFWTYFNLGNLTFWLIYGLVPCAIAVRVGFRSIDRLLPDWQKNHDLALSPESRPYVLRHIRRGRHARTIGFIVGWLTPPVLHVIVRDERTDWPLVIQYSWLIAYAVSAAGSALWTRQTPAEAGAATLERRTPSDYLPRWVVYAQRGAVALPVALFALFAGLPHKDPHSWNRMPNREFVLMALPIIVVVLLTEIGQHLVVRRMQPFAGNEMRAVDDALRSNSLHAMSGAAAAIIGAIASPLLFEIAGSSDPWAARTFGWIAGLFFPWFALALLVGYADPTLGWRVRRRSYRETAPS